MTKRGILLALTNPVAGREDEFNEWYDKVHMADVLKIPGIVSARRFRVTADQHTASPAPWQYCATYDLETDDIAALASELRRRRGQDGEGTPEMTISNALAEERLSWVFEEITESGGSAPCADRL